MQYRCQVQMIVVLTLIIQGKMSRPDQTCRQYGRYIGSSAALSVRTSDSEHYAVTICQGMKGHGLGLKFLGWKESAVSVQQIRWVMRNILSLSVQS